MSIAVMWKIPFITSGWYSFAWSAPLQRWKHSFIWCLLMFIEKKKDFFFFDSLRRLMQKSTTRGMLRKTHTFLCRLSSCCWTGQNLSWQRQLCKGGKNTGNNKTRRSCFNQPVGSSCNELQLLYKADVKARSQTNRAWCLSESALKRKN